MENLVLRFYYVHHGKGKNMKRKIKVLCLLLIAASLIGCTKRKVPTEYITYTHTKTVSEGVFASEVYQYKVGSEEEPVLIAEVPYTAQYPLTVYDEAHDKVYYTARIPNTKVDQVFEYDPNTKEKVQVTDTLGAINYMVPLKQGLFLGALPSGADDLFIRPYVLDYDSKELTEILFDEELSINHLIYDQNSETIYMSAHDQVEHRRIIINQDKEEYVSPGNNIMSIDKDLNIKELAKTPSFGVADLSVLDDVLYIRGTKKMFGELEMFKVDLNIQDNKLLDVNEEDEKKLEDIGFFIGVDESNTLVYFISSYGPLYEYDRKTKEKRILRTPTAGASAINNGLILKMPEK